MTSVREADIERRLSALEQRVNAMCATANPTTDRAEVDDTAAPVRDLQGSRDPLWALRELECQIAEAQAAPRGGADNAGVPSTLSGAVMVVGSVGLPTGPVKWQIGLPTLTLAQADWAQHAPTLTALGHPVRLALLQRVLSGTTQTSELADSTDLGTTGQLHHHLRILVSAGWLRLQKRGHYEIPSGRVIPLLAMLLAAQDA